MSDNVASRTIHETDTPTFQSTGMSVIIAQFPDGDVGICVINRNERQDAFVYFDRAEIERVRDALNKALMQ